MSDRKVTFANRFQVTVFNEYVACQFAYQMNDFNPDGTISDNHTIRDSEYINMTVSDAKSFALFLIDTISRREQETGVHIPIPDELRPLWNQYIKDAE